MTRGRRSRRPFLLVSCPVHKRSFPALERAFAVAEEMGEFELAYRLAEGATFLTRDEEEYRYWRGEMLRMVVAMLRPN
jgi:hypothetical protein